MKLLNFFKAKNRSCNAELIVRQQVKINELELAIDNVFVTLMDYDSVTIKKSDNPIVEHIHQIILEYKKELLKTKQGTKFLHKYKIDVLNEKKND